MSTLAHTSANRALDCTHTLTGSTGGWMTRGAVRRVYLDGHCGSCKCHNARCSCGNGHYWRSKGYHYSEPLLS